MDELDQDVCKRDILGVSVADIDASSACEIIYQALTDDGLLRVGFLNAHNANIAAKDAEFAQIMTGFLTLPDGIGVDIAARLLYGSAFAENLNGTDFVPLLLSKAPGALDIGLFGAQPGVAEEAAEQFSELVPRHRFRAYGHGYANEAEQSSMLEEIGKDRPDVLLVALGTPGQEKWISQHISHRHCSVAIGVGALFDFMAGRVSRAPNWVRAIRMEWVYRLAIEPRRMWRRYLVGNAVFLGSVLKQRRAQKSLSGASQ